MLEAAFKNRFLFEKWLKFSKKPLSCLFRWFICIMRKRSCYCEELGKYFPYWRKMRFFIRKYSYLLGLIVSKNKITIWHCCIPFVHKWPRHNIIWELRDLIGLTQFSQICIESISRIDHLIENMTLKNSDISKWSEKCDRKFKTLKKITYKAPIIFYTLLEKWFEC